MGEQSEALVQFIQRCPPVTGVPGGPFEYLLGKISNQFSLKCLALQSNMFQCSGTDTAQIFGVRIMFPEIFHTQKIMWKHFRRVLSVESYWIELISRLPVGVNHFCRFAVPSPLPVFFAPDVR